jgi:hypothetical protein
MPFFFSNPSFYVRKVVRDVAATQPLVIFYGTQFETDELQQAINANCVCVMNDAGMIVEQCTVHRMLVSDQRALNGLLWMRRSVDQLKDAEGLGGG